MDKKKLSFLPQSVSYISSYIDKPIKLIYRDKICLIQTNWQSFC